MQHTPHAIANSFLDISMSSPTVEPIDPMKVQKLVYFAHGWHLGFGRGALCAEHAEAWRWGPVFPSLYHSVKAWGNSAIMEPIRAAGRISGQFQLTEPRVPTGLSEHVLIGYIWQIYGCMSGLQLSQITHEEGSPWQAIKNQSPSVEKPTIPNELIRRYFESKIPGHANS